MEAGAKKVYGCDSNPVMISIAKNVFENVPSPNKICLIEKHSNEMEIPDDLDLRYFLIIVIRGTIFWRYETTLVILWEVTKETVKVNVLEN